jgi:hypothetical protein
MPPLSKALEGKEGSGLVTFSWDRFLKLMCRFSGKENKYNAKLRDGHPGNEMKP